MSIENNGNIFFLRNHGTVNFLKILHMFDATELFLDKNINW